MTTFYSKSANSFFVENVHTAIPADRVAVPQDVWQHLIAAQGTNSQLSADAKGNPILVNPQNADAVIYTSVGQT